MKTTFWKARYFNVFLMHFMSFINYLKPKTIFKSSLNSHVYRDTPCTTQIIRYFPQHVLCFKYLKIKRPFFQAIFLSGILGPYSGGVAALGPYWEVTPKIMPLHKIQPGNCLWGSWFLWRVMSYVRFTLKTFI